MKKIFIIFILIIITFILSCKKDSEETSKTILKETVECENDNITWLNGVALIEGKPRFLEPIGTLHLSYKYIEKCKTEILKNSVIMMTSDTKKLFLYDSKKNDPYSWLTKTKKVLYYKVENCNFYISDDRENWDQLEIKIVDENPPIGTDEDHPAVMIIHLKCKWFEGDYEIIGES
ncbi:MAG: hypothetical protein JW976_08955 [Syntrophaceae bacterium]|nr:hypothetical protein [Syntrophaceae bacterium]